MKTEYFWSRKISNSLVQQGTTPPQVDVVSDKNFPLKRVASYGELNPLVGLKNVSDET